MHFEGFGTSIWLGYPYLQAMLQCLLQKDDKNDNL